MEIEFVAGFAVIVPDPGEAAVLYRDALGLPLAGEGEYLSTDDIPGTRHFGIWPLAHAASAAGKEVVASFGSPFELSEAYAFLDLSALVPPEEFPTDPEVMIALDVAAVERLGERRQVRAALRLVLCEDGQRRLAGEAEQRESGDPAKLSSVHSHHCSPFGSTWQSQQYGLMPR